MMERNTLAKMIDQSLLAPNVGQAEIEAFVKKAVACGFRSCCVNVSWLELTAKLLKGTDTLPCVTAAFPFGAVPVETKLAIVKDCLRLGAQEVDYVINIGKAVDRDYPYLEKEAKAMVAAVHEQGAKVKAILEMCYLDAEQKRVVAKIASRCGVDFLKTSTGYGKGGATVEDVALLREIGGPEIGVKASGGIRTFEDAMRMIQAGANRIGTSNGVAILDGIK